MIKANHPGGERSEHRLAEPDYPLSTDTNRGADQRRFSLRSDEVQCAVNVARACTAFKPDDADEWAVEEERSCFNCRWRRWVVEAMVCMLPDAVTQRED